MKKLIIINLILCLTMGCTQTKKTQSLKKGHAIITGEVTNLQGDTRAIRIAAGGVVENIERTVIIDSLGNFRVEIELFNPQNVQMFFKKGYVKVFLYPEDSIHLEMDETVFRKERFPFYEISGSEKSVSFSENIRDYLRYAGERPFNPDASKTTVDEFHAILEQEISTRDSIMQIFCKGNKVIPEFKNWLQRDIRYSIANYLLNYHFANPNYNGNLFDKILFPVDDDNAITASLYSYHLRHHAYNLGFWQDTVTLNHLKAEQVGIANRRCLDKIISNEKEGLSRDLMCYQVLYGLYKQSYKDYSILLEDVDVYIETPLLKDVLQAKKTAFENQEKFDITYLDPVTKEEKEITGNFWNNLNDKYKGKVIYVDIWATWCGPCRSEIPHAIEQHEIFKGKDIAFVNLCLASDKNEWQIMIKENNIMGDNYFFNEAQTQILRDKLKFEGYPTYLIIDKNGKLIDKNAPRPSSNKIIRKKLEELIAENVT